MSDTRTDGKTDWHDAQRIARLTGMTPGGVRYHWERAYDNLDIPPSGWLSPEQARRLIDYMAGKRRERRRKADLQAF